MTSIEKSRILLVGTRGIPARYGGFETLCEKIDQFSHHNSYACAVTSLDWQGGARPVFDRLLPQSISTAIRNPYSTWQKRSELLAGKAEVILVFNPVNVWAAKWLARRGCSVFLHLDGFEDRRAKWGLIARNAHRLARKASVRSRIRLVVDSKAIQAWYAERYGRETSFIPYGGCSVAELVLSHRWTAAKDFYMVLARPEPENQILEICRAFRSSTVTGELIIVGAPTNETQYWASVKREAELDDRIQLAGSIWDREILCEMFMTTRGVIHGHTVGGTNPSLVDAMSHGAPVYAHDNPYNREVLHGSGRTWSSVEELTALIDADEPETVAPSADFVNEHIGRYNWESVVNSYMELFGLVGGEQPDLLA